MGNVIFFTKPQEWHKVRETCLVLVLSCDYTSNVQRHTHTAAFTVYNPVYRKMCMQPNIMSNHYNGETVAISQCANI